MTSQAEPLLRKRPPRERILLTAQDLFYKDGVRATGIDKIIAESAVTKVTFYRYFPSKNDLILAFLSYRHQRWMTWFFEALHRHGAGDGAGLKALVPALDDWFRNEEYRGCAFLNSVGEMGGTIPEVIEIARSHKEDMTVAIEALLPASECRLLLAQAISLAVDGAILRAQYATPDAALAPLDKLVQLVSE